MQNQPSDYLLRYEQEPARAMDWRIIFGIVLVALFIPIFFIGIGGYYFIKKRRHIPTITSINPDYHSQWLISALLNSLVHADRCGADGCNGCTYFCVLQSTRWTAGKWPVRMLISFANWVKVRSAWSTKASSATWSTSRPRPSAPSKPSTTRLPSPSAFSSSTKPLL